MAEPCSMQVGVARFGVFEVELHSGELRKSGVRIKLQEQPFKVLVALVERPGELVTRAELKSRIWPDMEFGDFDHAVNLSINKLRTALGDSADTPRFIETLPRRGYRLVAPVELLPANGASARVNSQPMTVMPSRQERSRRWMLLAGVACVAVLAGFAAWELWPRPAIESVAVLPFTADDPALQYLGDGIAETLTDNLTQLPKLHVLSRNSTFQFRNAKMTMRDLAQRLGVRGLVMGTVRREEDGALRVAVELVDGRDDRHLWGGEYTISAAQLAKAQSRIAQDVFLGLHYRLDGNQRARLGHRYTTNADAYDAYLRGQYILRNRALGKVGLGSPEQPTLAEAVALFQRSARLDPNFALAYVGLQAAYGISAGVGMMPPNQALPLAEAAVQRSLQLAPELSEAHVGAAYQQLNLHRNVSAAVAEAERAVELDPNLPEAHQAYALALGTNGQVEEALHQHSIAIRLDPEWALAKQGYAMCLIWAGHYERAQKEARKFDALGPELLALSFIQRGRSQDALQELDGHPGKRESDSNRYLRAWAQAELGNSGPVRELLQQKLELRRKHYVAPSQIAMLYAILHDRGNTLAWVNNTIQEHDPGLYLPFELPFRFLADDPEYQQLRRRMFTPE